MIRFTVGKQIFPISPETFYEVGDLVELGVRRKFVSGVAEPVRGRPVVVLHGTLIGPQTIAVEPHIRYTVGSLQWTLRRGKIVSATDIQRPLIRDLSVEAALLKQVQAELAIHIGTARVVKGQAGAEWENNVRNSGKWEWEGDCLVANWAPPTVTLVDGVVTVTKSDEKLIRKFAISGSSGLLTDGERYYRPPTDWLKQNANLIIDLLDAQAATGSVAPRQSAFDLALLCRQLDLPAPAAVQHLWQLMESFTGVERATLPSDLTVTLRDYQIQGVNWLHFLKKNGFGGLLADDMGLGKTLQTLTTFAPRPASNEKNPRAGNLVVAPTSVLKNWEREIKRFRPGLSVALYRSKKRNLAKLIAENDVIVTSYGILRLDITKFASFGWDCVVLDEAQAIKNPESQIAQAVSKLDIKFPLGLSGTPIENRLEELWSLMRFANKGLLGGRKDFVTRYAVPISEGHKEVSERLRQRVKPFILRRMKSEVATELPPRTDSILYVTLNPEERTAYTAIRAAAKKEVAVLAGREPMKMLAAINRLRQAACHTGLVPGREGVTASSKVSLMIEKVQELAAEGHKALVFSQWTSFLDLMEPHLVTAGIPFIRIDGTVSANQRQVLVDQFQSQGGPVVFLLSLMAANSGLNLTRASYVFLMDPWWNPTVEAQAHDRTHRIGQTNPVTVYRMVAEDTIEEAVLALQERKRHLSASILSGAEGAAQLTQDDLRNLLTHEEENVDE